MRRWFGGIVVLAALVVACGCDESSGRMQVVVDGDGAIDDIKALVYLLEQPDVEVLAVTVSGTGIAHCPVAAENMAAMLQRIGVSGIPVACGRPTPLEGSNAAPEAWRNAADTLGGVDLPTSPDLGDATAVGTLTDTISGADSVVLVALGPLTNVAEAFEADPSLVDGIEMMYVMGGAVDAGGNVLYANPAAEFNIWADPHAAAVVFDTDVPITLIPLDATNTLPVTPYLYEAVAAHRHASPVAEFMADYLDVSPLFGGMYHWDELAAVTATDESVVTLENRRLEIVESGGVAAGATVESPTGRSVLVAVDADRARFEDHFYRAIIGTADPGVGEWAPDATVTWDGTTCRYAGPDPMPLSMWIRFDNESSDLVALLTGRYAEGTTSEDWDAYVASGATDPPGWWQQKLQLPVPAGGHEVWPITAGEGVTAVCYVDETRYWELAGPRLSG
jgi:pyrimidine-specific ribonucleoside hydrolase